MGNAAETRTLIEWIYQKYAQKIWSCAIHYVEENMAEDIVHEVMVAIMERVEAVEGRSEAEIRAYVLKLAKNACIDYLRGIETKAESIEAIMEEKQVNWKTREGDPTAWMEQDELAKVLKRSIGKLTPENRIVVEYHARFQLSNDEIAEQLCLSRRTVDQRLCRGRKELRRVLRGVGYYV